MEFVSRRRLYPVPHHSSPVAIACKNQRGARGSCRAMFFDGDSGFREIARIGVITPLHYHPGKHKSVRRLGRSLALPL